MRKYAPLIINRKCLLLNSLPIIAFIIISLVGNFFIHKAVLISSFVILSLFILLAIVFLLRRVFDIEGQLKNDILIHARKLLHSDKDEDDPFEWLNSLKTELLKSNMHHLFFFRYFICLMSAVFGFAGLYKLLYLANIQNFTISPSGAVGLFDFLYLSFVILTTSSYENIVPASGLVRMFIMLEIVTGIMFLVIMLEIYFSSREGLKTIANRVVDDVETLVQKEYDEASKIQGKMKKVLKDFRAKNKDRNKNKDWSS